jgi:hypothetical protein
MCNLVPIETVRKQKKRNTEFVVAVTALLISSFVAKPIAFQGHSRASFLSLAKIKQKSLRPLFLFFNR